MALRPPWLLSLLLPGVALGVCLAGWYHQLVNDVVEVLQGTQNDTFKVVDLGFWHHQRVNDVVAVLQNTLRKQGSKDQGFQCFELASRHHQRVLDVVEVLQGTQK